MWIPSLSMTNFQSKGLVYRHFKWIFFFFALSFFFWSLLWTCAFWLIWWVLTCAYINETITVMKIMNASNSPKRFFMPLCKFILTSSLVPRQSLICCLLLSNGFHFKEFYKTSSLCLVSFIQYNDFDNHSCCNASQ